VKICRFEGGYGLVVGDDVIDVTTLIATGSREQGDPLIRALPKLRALSSGDLGKYPRRALSGLALLSPVTQPTKILAAPNNYPEHTHEMQQGSVGHGLFANLSKAGFFLKATSSLVGPSEGIAQRFLDRRTDYEIELVAVIGKTGNNVSESDAMSHVAGYALGLDITVRGEEERSLRKSIDTYTVLGPWLTTVDEISDIGGVEFSLSQNGELRQQARVSDMLFDVAQQIAFASRFYTLYPGDLIYSGTPSGVGPIRPGDTLHAVANGLGAMDVKVRDAAQRAT
jgi:2-keto-4-pentenoate hydratase/2-oxohepta-3-ene-1,7-dioic acid hydratase in catechol pathway